MNDSGDQLVPRPNGQVKRPETDIYADATTQQPRRRPEHHAGDGGDDFEMPFDPRRLVAIFKKRWLLLLKAGVAGGILLAVVGFWRLNYHVNIVLLSRDSGTAFVAGTDGLAFKPRTYSSADISAIIQNNTVLRKAAYTAHPPIDEKELRARLTVSQDRGAESLLGLTLSGKNRYNLVELANVYASNAVDATKELQLSVAHEMNDFYQKKIIEYDKRLDDINHETITFLANAGLSDPENEAKMYNSSLANTLQQIDSIKMQAKMNALEQVAVRTTMGSDNVMASTKLQEAYQQLEVLLAKYTTNHPDVIKQQAVIEGLQRLARPTMPSTSTNMLAGRNDPTSPLYQRGVDIQIKSATYVKQLEELEKLRDEYQTKIRNLMDNSTKYAMIRSRLDELMQARKLLASRQQEAQLYEDNAEGYYRLYSPATLNDVDRKARIFKSLLFGFAGFVLGVVCAAGFVAVREIFDDRIKTQADVKRVTGLDVLVTLGDLNKMTEAQKEEWAFHAWTALSGQLTISPNHGMVCGFISSTHSEGRSTWVNMLVNAASQRGLRVLTVATRSKSEPGDLFHAEASAKADERAFESAVAAAMSISRAEGGIKTEGVDPQSLIFPAEISQKLALPNGPPVAHIALPGWVWNLERRKQWQSALTQWRQVDNLVLLVELPPASMPEAILLAENLPQLVWLVDSGKARAKETRKQLKTLRHAKCRLVGAVLNHEPEPVFEL